MFSLLFSESDSSLQVRGFPRLSRFWMHGLAGTVSLFQFQTSTSKHFEEILVIDQYFVYSSVAAGCLQFGTLFCPFCEIFSFVSWMMLSKLQAIHYLSGSLLNFRGSSVYPLESFKKSCTWDLISCRPSPFLKKIDTLPFGPFVIDVSETLLILVWVSLSLRRLTMGSGMFSIEVLHGVDVLVLQLMDHESSVFLPFLWAVRGNGTCPRQFFEAESERFRCVGLRPGLQTGYSFWTFCAFCGMRAFFHFVVTLFVFCISIFLYLSEGRKEGRYHLLRSIKFQCVDVFLSVWVERWRWIVSASPFVWFFKS